MVQKSSFEISAEKLAEIQGYLDSSPDSGRIIGDFRIQEVAEIEEPTIAESLLVGLDIPVREHLATRDIEKPGDGHVFVHPIDALSVLLKEGRGEDASALLLNGLGGFAVMIFSKEHGIYSPRHTVSV